MISSGMTRRSLMTATAALLGTAGVRLWNTEEAA